VLRMKPRAVAFSLIVLLISQIAACRSKPASYVANVTMNEVAGQPLLSGKLYLSNGRIRIDWGVMADVFDLKQRTGWRILEGSNAYQELGSKDLSTYVPEMTNGSLCPHSQAPPQCKLVGTEIVDGRPAKKWELYNPKGFHVYFWTDEQLDITVRMMIGESGYKVVNLHKESVPESLFQLPSGYTKVDRPFRP
jgi:hypothetical protein